MSRFLQPHMAQMAGYIPGEQPQGGGFIKLNTNENPYPPSPAVKEALAAAVDDRLRLYPDPMATEFRDAVATLHGVERDMVLAGNGSDDLLTIITRAFVGPGDVAGYPTPSYLLYSTLIALQGGRAAVVPYTRDWSLEKSAMTIPGLKLFFLANPDSPVRYGPCAASRWPISQARSTARSSSTKPTVISPTRFATRWPCSKTIPNIIVTRSFSKGYSLAGIRLGYLVARPELVAHLVKIKDSYNTDKLSQVAGTAALRDQAYLAETRARIIKTRGRASSEALRALGYTVTDSQSNFVWATDGPPAGTVFEQLKNRKILVRLMRYDGYPEGLRISIGTDAEIDTLLNTFKEIRL